MAMFHVKTVVADEYDSDFVDESSDDSLVSLSSTDLFDDATSASCSSSGSMSGPLYELSELMAQLPLKRGLSKFYQGKSESFGSLANLNNIQDLAKRSHRSRSKCRSQNQALSPKSTIIKSKKSCSSSLAKTLGEMSSILETIVVQNRF